MFAGERQIGLARVVTDYATYGYLADVFVVEGYRGQGLGKWLMECVMAHPARFGLVTRDAQGLYQQFGFRELANSGPHMEIVRPEVYLATVYLATRPPSTIK